MKIKRVELFWVNLPLNFTFKSAKQSQNDRGLIVIKVVDESGICGYGEVVAFETPSYTPETLDQAWTKLVGDYIPKLTSLTLKHPFEIHQHFSKELPMTLASIEMAMIDLYENMENKSVMDEVFNEPFKDVVPGGIVIGNYPLKKIITEINKYTAMGYHKFKIKIDHIDGLNKLKEIRKYYPSLALTADGNQDFDSFNMEEINVLDELNLLCIEEPFKKPLEVKKSLLKHLKTPICFDESIIDLHSYEKMAHHYHHFMVNIKISRLGGLYYTKEMICRCRKDGIKFWIGSMVESGISKPYHLKLAGLKDIVMPGDLADSERYFHRDLIIPHIMIENGYLNTYQKGVVSEERLEQYLVKGYKYNVNECIRN